jgi:hypothetical protein
MWHVTAKTLYFIESSSDIHSNTLLLNTTLYQCSAGRQKENLVLGYATWLCKLLQGLPKQDTEDQDLKVYEVQTNGQHH